jgi:photosystem II stability/assembly factor-like uncharacterized protein
MNKRLDMQIIRRWTSLTFLLFSLMATGFAQKADIAEETEKSDTSSIYNGLEFRSIGPAFMSGRIADIVIHPENENVWYVAVGSGGVWKTENSGTTWTSIFDDQVSYSIGCLALDPQNPDIVWVGTGENHGGRHLAYGDGIYKSEDGGKSWKNMGLETSEHISKIIIHPTNSDIIWVASQGPLWSSGGERGIYKSIDGGATWQRTLGDEEWVGATDLLIDPRDPDLLYAATWQRHRTVAGYMGGGPGTAIYKSKDGGDTWEKLSKGLPRQQYGKNRLRYLSTKSRCSICSDRTGQTNRRSIQKRRPGCLLDKDERCSCRWDRTSLLPGTLYLPTQFR